MHSYAYILGLGRAYTGGELCTLAVHPQDAPALGDSPTDETKADYLDGLWVGLEARVKMPHCEAVTHP